MIEREPLEVPRPELTGRILAHVLPSRVRRRRLAALGLGYAAGLAATVAGVALWMFGAGGSVALRALPAWLWRHRLRGGLSALDALGASAVNLATGWSWLEAVAARLAPLTRALRRAHVGPPRRARRLGGGHGLRGPVVVDAPAPGIRVPGGAACRHRSVVTRVVVSLPAPCGA